MSNAQGDDPRWKRKYYDSLDELERKERAWEGVEQALYHSLGRVALAAYGADRDLDRHLDRLREALRLRRDGSRIAALVERVCECAEAVHAGGGQSEALDPVLFAVRLVDALDLPPHLERAALKLKKRLSGGQCDLEQAAGELAALLARARPEEPAPARAPGLRRLFGGPATPEPRAPGASTAAAALARLLGALELPPGQRGRAEAVAARCAGPGSDLDTLFEEAASLIGAALAELAGASGGEHEAAREGSGGPSTLALGEVLMGLLDQLELPPDSQPRIDALKQRVSAGIDLEGTAGVLASVAGLVGELRAEMRRERLDMQAFLAGLSERLGMLDGALGESREGHAGSLRGSEELDRKVSGEVEAMRGEVVGAADLEGLRRLIEGRLTAISRHVETHLSSERERFSAANSRIERLENTLRATLVESHSLKAAIEVAQDRASRDGLTGVLNRAAFDQSLAAEYARVRRYGGTLSLLFWDIDHFKSINDSWGHPVGDRVLENVASLLGAGLRETDRLARYGGEEFVVLMPETPLDGALKVAEKLRAAVEAANFHHRERRVPVTASCGVAELLPGEPVEEFVHRADEALYAAKAAGRNRCEAA